MADFYLQCNDLKVPEQDFTRQFCVRCLQGECSRSRPHGTKFDERVRTWEDRLFLQVPVLPADDPRYQGIANQPFVEVGPGWGDPYEVQGSPDPSREPTPTPGAPEAPPPITPQPARFLGQAVNTPARKGIMLEGAPGSAGVPAQAPTSVDPWAGPDTPKPASPGDIVVKVGGRVKMGGLPK